MSISKKATQLHKTARRIFEEATTASLGSACNTVITFHLKRKFGKDPYEVFVEDPKRFFEGLKEVFGAGAECMIGLIGASMAKKYCLTCTAEEFASLVTKGDEQSKRRLVEMLSEVASGNEE